MVLNERDTPDQSRGDFLEAEPTKRVPISQKRGDFNRLKVPPKSCTL